MIIDLRKVSPRQFPPAPASFQLKPLVLCRQQISSELHCKKQMHRQETQKQCPLQGLWCLHPFLNIPIVQEVQLGFFPAMTLQPLSPCAESEVLLRRICLSNRLPAAAAAHPWIVFGCSPTSNPTRVSAKSQATTAPATFSESHNQRDMDSGKATVDRRVENDSSGREVRVRAI